MRADLQSAVIAAIRPTQENEPSQRIELCFPIYKNGTSPQCLPGVKNYAEFVFISLALICFCSSVGCDPT